MRIAPARWRPSSATPTPQTHLIEDLLDVSRAISGKLQLKVEPVNVGEAVLAAVETLRPAIASKGLAFETDVDTTLAPILADTSRLQQVVWNLLSNAIKFTPSGGTVRLRVSEGAGGVEITVHDTGAGIPEAFLPFVFDRFRQADAGTRRETGGLGLGLAISRHVVELHGGTITAQSRGEGTGATFRAFLPRHASTAGAVSA
jgi:signal transduction histidine kinase